MGNTIKRLAKLIRTGDVIALPGLATDPYDIEVYKVLDRWDHADGWTYLNVGLSEPVRLADDLAVTKVLPQRNSAGTDMVRIEGNDLECLREMLAGKDRKPYLLRCDQRGDSVAFKVNEGMWTWGMGKPQPPY